MFSRLLGAHARASEGPHDVSSLCWANELQLDLLLDERHKVAGMQEDHLVNDFLEVRSDMVDLSGLRLDQLDHLPETVFVAALRRVLRESMEQPNSYEQFQSAISTAPIACSGREECGCH